MSMQSFIAPTDSYKKEMDDSMLYRQVATKKEKKNRIAVFFGGLNPTTWFNDFSNIEITMEEFDSGKSNSPQETSSPDILNAIFYYNL